jgi:hypothetical protein
MEGFKGGQGRSAEEIEASGIDMVIWILMAAVLVVGAVLVAMGQ